MGLAGSAGAVVARRRRRAAPPEPWRRALDSHWGIGKWLAGSSLAYWWTVQGPFYLAASLLGASAPGILKACQNLLAPTHLLVLGMDGVMMPTAARCYRSGSHPTLRRYLGRTGLGLVLIVGAYVALVDSNAERLLDALYRGRYSGYGIIVVLTSIQYVMTASLKPFLVGLKAMGRTRPIFNAYLLAAGATTLLTIPLVTTLGLPGSIVSASVATGVYGAVLIVSFLRLDQGNDARVRLQDSAAQQVGAGS
jgi:O-antigen/teichoic acid export membrane protein